jgi:hypothetical protein
MGGPKFAHRVALEGVIMTGQQAVDVVNLYRNTYPKIPELWRALEYAAARYMLNKTAIWPSPWGDITFAHERLILPNGMPIIYPHLKKSPRGFKFDSRFAAGVERDIWGGMYLENIAQGLAGVIARRAELKLARLGLPCVHQVHDELIWVVPTALVDRVKTAVASVMTEVVDFMPTLPIAVEVKHGPTYGDAK